MWTSLLCFSSAKTNQLRAHLVARRKDLSELFPLRRSATDHGDVLAMDHNLCQVVYKLSHYQSSSKYWIMEYKRFDL